MPSTTLPDIQLSIYERVEAATGLLPLKHDDKVFKPNNSAYAELIISPVDTRSETIDGGDILPGFIVFNVYVPRNYGPYYPATEGQKFLDLFPRDLKLGQLRIMNTGTIRAPVENGEWNFTPVLIEYEADSCSQ